MIKYTANRCFIAFDYENCIVKVVKGCLFLADAPQAKLAIAAKSNSFFIRTLVWFLICVDLQQQEYKTYVLLLVSVCNDTKLSHKSNDYL